MYLQQFEMEIIHRPDKSNSNADALSRILEIECNFIGVEISGEKNENDDAPLLFHHLPIKMNGL